MPDTRRPDLLKISTDSVLRAASRTGSPARMARAAMVPPSAPIPTINTFISSHPGHCADFFYSRAVAPISTGSQEALDADGGLAAGRNWYSALACFWRG